MKGKGRTDETLRQSQLIVQGNLTIHAVEGLKIDLKHIDQKSVRQTIDAMVQADPNLAWLKDAEARGDVDWRRVQEVHDSFKYSHSGMGPATQLAVAIAAAAIGGMAAAGALSGAGAVVTGAGVGASGSLASTAAVNLINNKGNLGQTLSDTLSSDNLKQVAIAAVVGGLTAGYLDQLLQTKTNPLTGKVTVDLSDVSGVSRFAANQAAQNITSTALSKVLGQGGSFGDALKDSVYNTFAAGGFNWVGDFGQSHGLKPGDAQMVVLHALMGGLAAQARGDNFAAGAAGAGLNEALVSDLDQLVSGYSPENREALLSMSSQLVGLIAAVAEDSNASASQLETAAWAAKNSTQYNFLAHQDLDGFEAEARECKALGTCDKVQQKYRDLSLVNQDAVFDSCVRAPSTCIQLFGQLISEQKSLQERIAHLQLDSSIPFALKVDLDRYQLQNAAAISELIATESKLANIEKGASVSKAERDSLMLSAVSGVLFGKIGTGKATGAVELTFDKATRTWTTPAGLDYGQGSVQGNRVLHVLEHADPNPAKTTHSVFSMDRKEILGAVDEAWLKKSSPVVGDSGAYVVPMGRAIGTLGETNIKIIVRPGTNQVITAYPVK
ncbi:hypothetical protein D3C77_170420 [compost metagenome]